MRVLSVTGVQTCAIPIYDTARVMLVVLKLLLFPAAAAVTVAVCELEYVAGAVYTVLVDGPEVDRLPRPDRLQFTCWFAVIVTLCKAYIVAVDGLTLTDA